MAKLKSINPGQFLQSLVNNLEKRLSFEDEIIKDLSILDQSKWPSKPSIRHGEEQIKRLCKRFNLCTDQALNGMRDLLEQPTRTTTPLGESSHALHGILPASVGEPDDEPLNLSSEYVFLTPVVAPSTSTSIAPPDPPQEVCGPERRRRRRNAGAEDPYQKLLKMETEREVKQIELANEQIKLTLLQQKEDRTKNKGLGEAAHF
ncbi:hypothetical protein N1851_024937 [Merluccius polli]|uniref:Uncharacterized protein n=1 Tax=Merluccius polli TaxID=89951 RepID=A0AA47ME29_MERPO|nr:hypothetical protein N1851_024937 [Merluccius polli]